MSAHSWIDDHKFWIASHWLQQDEKPVPRQLSPNRGGRLKPEIIVLHETASPLTVQGDIDWLGSAKSGVSAHLVIGRDGSVTQLVPFDTIAWHCEPAKYKGRGNVNDYSIGIEMDGPGHMTESRPGYAKPWFDKEYSMAEHGIAFVETPDHGKGWWMPFTDPQIRTTIALCKLLVETYDIEDVTTHYAISPRRKVDPNPLFPIYWARMLALGKDKYQAQPMGRA